MGISHSLEAFNSQTFWLNLIKVSGIHPHNHVINREKNYIINMTSLERMTWSLLFLGNQRRYEVEVNWLTRLSKSFSLCISCRRCAAHSSSTTWSWGMCWNYCYVCDLPNGHGTRKDHCTGTYFSPCLLLLWRIIVFKKTIFSTSFSHQLKLQENDYFHKMTQKIILQVITWENVLDTCSRWIYILFIFFYRQRSLPTSTGECSMLYQLCSGRRVRVLCTRAGFLP